MKNYKIATRKDIQYYNKAYNDSMLLLEVKSVRDKKQNGFDLIEIGFDGKIKLCVTPLHCFSKIFQLDNPLFTTATLVSNIKKGDLIWVDVDAFIKDSMMLIEKKI